MVTVGDGVVGRRPAVGRWTRACSSCYGGLRSTRRNQRLLSAWDDAADAFLAGRGIDVSKDPHLWPPLVRDYRGPGRLEPCRAPERRPEPYCLNRGRPGEGTQQGGLVRSVSVAL